MKGRKGQILISYNAKEEPTKAPAAKTSESSDSDSDSDGSQVLSTGLNISKVTADLSLEEKIEQTRSIVSRRRQRENLAFLKVHLRYMIYIYVVFYELMTILDVFSVESIQCCSGRSIS